MVKNSESVVDPLETGMDTHTHTRVCNLGDGDRLAMGRLHGLLSIYAGGACLGGLPHHTKMVQKAGEKAVLQSSRLSLGAVLSPPRYSALALRASGVVVASDVVQELLALHHLGA